MLRSSGLKLSFTLICKPDLEYSVYREIASDDNVSSGSAGWLIRELKQCG
jgi:hypothetical protein